MKQKEADQIIKENALPDIEQELNDLREEKTFALYETDTFKGRQPKKKMV